MTDKTGGAAFPASGHPDMQFVAQEGMTLRDYFAAKAMQGILVNAERNEFSFGKVDEIASKAYELADAMLRAREK
ncbi:TPA: hypothetical protein MDC20_003284 [Morganella morganii]|uniref:hypothetical protein n=1 Tax=Morganella morganii TaxID=582 RepID=UPI000F5B7168|nr:hypothetical protein [Morganella morganii]HBU8232619.1 hypothetical protein [Morganella morganii]